MIDPLAEVVTLLQPSLRRSKLVSAAGSWGVRQAEQGNPVYCLILEGSCRLTLGDDEPMALQADDFVLIPAWRDMLLSGNEPPRPEDIDRHPVELPNGEHRQGTPEGPHEVRFLAGLCEFGSPDAALLVSLLPRVVLVRDEPRLSTLVQLASDEARAQRPAREVVLARLLEVLFIEALRSTAGTDASPGLLRGLADARLGIAIRHMHENPTRAWTVVQLAKEAALSRSSFFERFSREVGVAPMEYLLAWRMGLAKQLLRRGGGTVAEVAERVGYSSASTFSVAFARHVGMPPMRFARVSGGV
ncbi:AraC-type DNA-binding protein [Luteibacter sp. UNC138MFCol5.1]|uniref:AraC family transcriptional regulator n=1 Tax=Luteibacter sp. UNC138MFCol5.1 TaxID=1502774 RepID=UPI0008C3E234|nr:AraC family transcriptional regulator [Luteibacter sp. UNC138MFCol5.1]SEP09332.1 AraC-type DNA-binding protein [Luteibacter sp. UNC138MFCol5.1]